jgi:hypothetical protein
MLRKSLIAFTAATVVCAGSQAVAAGFRHAMSTPRTPFPRSEREGLANIPTCRNSDRQA